MIGIDNPRLRVILALDSGTCLIAGLVMTLGAAALAPFTNLPETLTRTAGLALFPIAALFAVMAVIKAAPRPLVLLAIFGNVAWVIASVVVLLEVPVTALGFVFVAAQAAVVAMLAALEWNAMSSSPRPASAGARGKVSPSRSTTA